MAESSITCPHCGANTTNHDVCDFCGSRIVISSTKETTAKTNGVLNKPDNVLHRMLEYARTYCQKSPAYSQPNTKITVSIHIFEQLQDMFGGQELLLDIDYNVKLRGGVQIKELHLYIPVEENVFYDYTDKDYNTIFHKWYKGKYSHQANGKNYFIFSHDLDNITKTAEAITVIYHEEFDVNANSLGYSFSTEGVPTEYYDKDGEPISEPTMQDGNINGNIKDFVKCEEIAQLTKHQEEITQPTEHQTITKDKKETWKTIIAIIIWIVIIIHIISGW